MRQQEAEIISSVLQRGSGGLLCVCVGFFFRLMFDFQVQRAESGLSSVSGLFSHIQTAKTHRSTVRSGDSGTVIDVGHCNRCLRTFVSGDCSVKKTPELEPFLV